MEKYPIKVLYVEDEIIVREPFVEMLNRRVGQIYEAANGAEGLELYRKYKPDIVIADIKMPVMDGLTMAAHIREEDPFTPIIITTAFEFTEYLEKCIEIGVNKFLVKPLEREAIDKALLDAVKLVEFKKKNEDYHELLELLLDFRHRIIIIIDLTKVNSFDTIFLNFFGLKSHDEFYEQYHDFVTFFKNNSQNSFVYDPFSEYAWINSFLDLNGIENNIFFNFSRSSDKGPYVLRFHLFDNDTKVGFILTAID